MSSFPIHVALRLMYMMLCRDEYGKAASMPRPMNQPKPDIDIFLWMYSCLHASQGP